MMQEMKNTKSASLRAAAVVVVFVLVWISRALGHEALAFGEHGDPKKPSRTVHVVMREEGTKMLYVPDSIDVKKGEQIRFVVDNEGLFNHEFILGTERDIRDHAAAMKKNPDMVHEDAHSLTVGMLTSGELLWRFTRVGRFVYACLIPGHLERGMRGTIVVK
jgi:uncharacterized cupredoxin-like copper-binding protein